MLGAGLVLGAQGLGMASDEALLGLSCPGCAADGAEKQAWALQGKQAHPHPRSAVRMAVMKIRKRRLNDLAPDSTNQGKVQSPAEPVTVPFGALSGSGAAPPLLGSLAGSWVVVPVRW